MDSPEQPGRLRRSLRLVSQTFFKGLIAILPVGATIFVLLWLASGLEGVFGPFVAMILGDYYRAPMGVITGLILVLILGTFLNAWIVQQVLAATENILQRIPLAKTVFNSVRDVRGFLSKSDKTQLGQVVIVDMGGTGVRMVGFLTRKDLADLPPVMGGSQAVTVYFPFSYAIGGFTAVVPRTAVRPVDMPMEAAMRFVITAGMKGDAEAKQPAGAGAAEP